jgi:hypothetical protein
MTLLPSPNPSLLGGSLVGALGADATVGIPMAIERWQRETYSEIARQAKETFPSCTITAGKK